MMSSTTIKISRRTKSGLEKQKTHPGDTYESVISRLLEYASQDDSLSDKAIKNMEQGIADIRAGRVHSSAQVKKRLGLK